MLQTAGPLCSTDVTRHRRSYGPFRHPLAFDRFPGLAGYTIYLAPVISQPGRGGLLQLLGMSLPPCCRFHPAEVTNRISQISVRHAAFALRMRARPSNLFNFEAKFAFTVVTARRLVNLPKGDLVDRLQGLGSPPPCYPNYGASDCYPGKTDSY